MIINIPHEFSDTPGPRYRGEGAHSGEDFRETLLRPRFEEAERTGETLTIELDGARFGYPSSFLEESFGGLARNTSIERVLRTLVFQSSEEPGLIEEIKSYIRDANKTSKQRAAAR